MVGKGARLQRIAGQVVENGDFVVLHEPPGQAGADESRAAGDADMLTLDHWFTSLMNEC
jgi:hypothetical protein